MSANSRQVGGGHYRGKSQHWDLVVDFNWNYFEAQIIKYVMRHQRKNGVEDLKKAVHFLEKYIEILEEPEEGEPTAAYVDQD